EVPVYGMVSLHQFAGGVRFHDGKQVLAISMDKVINIDRDFDMVFTHEAFHVFHLHSNPTMQEDISRSSDLLIVGMFIEGLATYAEGALNPEKPHRRMVAPLMAWCDGGEYKKYLDEFLADNKVVSHAAREKTKHLYAKWFYTKRDGDFPFPTEAAYCIGDRVVDQLAGTYSMTEMAKWPVPRMIAEAKRILQQWSVKKS